MNGGEDERGQDRRPEGGDWRADSLARSRHSRMELPRPVEDFDPHKAELLCAEVTRSLLGDFSPALLLFHGTERRRVQALLAYAHTLFDFARQTGVEGERLAQINRFTLTLESALSGEPVGQPIFVAMSREHARRPWPLDALDELAGRARWRAMRPRPATSDQAEAEAVALASTVGSALLEEAWSSEMGDLGGAVVRLWGLQRLGDELRRHRCPLAVKELPEGAERDRVALLGAIRRECARLHHLLLRAPRSLTGVPAGYRRAAVYALHAAVRLLSVLEEEDLGWLEKPPRLGLGARLTFLLRARWTF